MKHIYSFLLLFVAVCTTSFVYAQDYNKDEVQQMASAFLGNGISTFSNATSTLTIDSLFLGDNPKMFLCQNGTNWVVLANEQLVKPVVCHGEGTITLDELYESPLWFLLTESMIGLDSIRILGDEANQEGFATDNGIATLASSTAMTPLLEKNGDINKWNQTSNNSGTKDLNKSYNKFCPAFYKLPEANGSTYAGCTAVAMGQILWYWKYPSSARIPVSIDIAGITSKDFETHYYDWKNMPGSICNNASQKQVDNIAGLLRDCGYSGNMIYGEYGSSMTLTNALYALRNDFNYSAHMKQYSSGAKKFNNIIKAEIAAGRPVMIQATHTTKGGTHTFIIDGYDSKAEEYHLNLGWGGGSENTWYSVSGSDSYYNYRIARRMLYEIIPNNTKQAVAPQNYAAETENGIITIVGNNITLGASDIEQWAIYDNYGYLMLKGNEPSINIADLPNGLYVIRVQIAGYIESKTFLKH